MLKRFSFLLFVFPVTVALAQENILETLERQYDLDLNPTDYPELRFEWNFEGKSQAFVNAGITEMVENNQHEKAITQFDRAIERLPDFAPSFYYRGICHKVVGDITKARADLEAAMAKDPASKEILLELAEVYEAQFQLPAAEKLYIKIMRAHPGWAETYYNLANMSIRRQEVAKADRYYAKCIELDPTFAKSLVGRGLLAFYTAKRVSKTLGYFNGALAIDSTFQAALFWRGLLYLKEKNTAQCLQDWDKLVTYNPGNPTFKLLRAFLYLALPDFDKAFVDLKNVFSANYSNENKFRGAQSILDKQLDFQFAVSYITRTVYGLDDDAGSAVRRGFCFMVMENRHAARVELQRSYRMQPSALSLFLTAMNFEHGGRHDSAFAYYEKALSFDNAIFDAHKKQAIYRGELRDFKTANKHFAQMLRLEPALLVTYRLRAQVRATFDDYVGAVLDFNNYLNRDSSDYEVLRDRGHCRFKLDDPAGANVDYRKALALNPEEYDLYELVVNTDLTVKDTTHALETLTIADEKFGLDYYLFITRTRIYIHKGELARAKSEVKVLITQINSGRMFTPEAKSTVYYLDGWIAFLQRNNKQALKDMNRALSASSSNHEAMFLRSKILLESGERTRAIKDLRHLARLNYAAAQALLATLAPGIAAE